MSQDLIERLEDCFDTPYNVRLGRKTPHADRLSMKDGGVIYDGTVLYADIVGSTALGGRFGYDGAAKIIQSFVLGASRLVTDWDGDVTAYDGDRVMAVFGGDDQEQNAVACAFSLAYLVRRVLNPMINKRFRKSLLARHLRCCCGIDTGEMLAVKIGLRGNTDLLWSGRPANYAAKLCAHRKPVRCTVITGRVFQRLTDELKRSADVSYWQRFTCDRIDMAVFGSDTVMPIEGV
jgi:class 3 adenylate cyclase